MVYGHSGLYETARYMADIVAREGMTAPVKRWRQNGGYDIRLTFFPSSDRIMPFALFAAVLEFNDQNRILPVDQQFDRPGWQDIGNGSRNYEIRNRNNFFVRAEEKVVQDAGFFPLFRPCIYAVTRANVKGLDFDFYGYSLLEKTVKFSDSIPENESVGGL
jgi:hypothetical protein